MDLKDWKKIKEDDKTVEMKHPKGHTMVIALHMLPPIQREQIKRLPMAEASGGRISDDEVRQQREERRDSEGAPVGTNEHRGVWTQKSDRSIDAVQGVR